METSQELKERLDALRPLDAGRIARLFPHWRAEDALFVYATNAVEGSTLTLGETIAVLEHGVSIGGKPVADHLDAINGQKAYALMLDLAQRRAPITLETILDLHRAVVGDATYAGTLRDEAVYIRGSLHVPPNHVKVPRLMDEMLALYAGERSADEHPVSSAAKLHFRLLTIHPFKDGNGRTARLLQNLALIREGYVPVLIGPEEKPRYFDVLQSAQVAVPGIGDPAPFVAYVADLEAASLGRYLASLE
jgi:cell filamentation protein, protein adenylyltransferase